MSHSKSPLSIVLPRHSPGASLILLLSGLLGLVGTAFASDYPVQPVPFTAVKITGGFWKQKQDTNLQVTLPFAFQQCEDSGRLKNFDLAAEVLRRRAAGEKEFQIKPPTIYPFDDTDAYKAIEGASYVLSTRRDPELEAKVDAWIARIAAAQEADGYLYTFRTMHPDTPGQKWVGKGRWEADPELSHELYNAGHLYEAGVAYFEATGKRSLLDICLRNAELLWKDFGDRKRRIAPGHQIIELGLARLYRATKDKRWLELAQIFLDARGPGGPEYNQRHKLVIDQDTAVGHAVRANYMYSGMADVAALTGDTRYTQAITAIWENMASRKLYLTGGVGALAKGEAYGADYELPQDAYNETCAALAQMAWDHRMFLLTGDAKYMDVFERTAFNGFISGVSLSGDRFFYPNPLSYDGKSKNNHEHAGRAPWFGCACCPPNLMRILASLSGYFYAVRDRNLYVNFYAQSEGRANIAGTELRLTQVTEYPWSGDVKLLVEPSTPLRFALQLRIPGWSRGKPVPSDLYSYEKPETAGWELRLNGQPLRSELNKGYFVLEREWRKGDRVELHFKLPLQRVRGNEKIAATHNQVALERGPVVFCVEALDGQPPLDTLTLPQSSPLTEKFQPTLLGGVMTLQLGSERTAIPYHAWNNRGLHPMRVWFPLAAAEAQTQAVKVTVDASASKAISPDLVGVFFEDINYAADGGLYAELIQNRSFEYSATEQLTWNNFSSWELLQRDGKASASIDRSKPVHPNNPHSVVLNIREPGEGVGLLNSGFDGIPVKAGETYDVAFFARQCHMDKPWDRNSTIAGNPMPVTVRLETKDGKSLGEVSFSIAGYAWARHSAELVATGSDEAARFVLLAKKKGAIGLDEVSLFPRKTFHGRRNGLRPDLAQLIADLKPKFIRFPGGCLAHGNGLDNIYRWKDTIGPIEQRKGQPNIWGYHQSVGLGYFEYFQFCEDIGAKPLPVLAAGVSCQNSAHTPLRGQQCIDLADMPAYIQEVLDLIEYANGPVTSTWGAKRAAAGHPEPFHLQYLGIGNEDHITPGFEERFRMIYAAVKAKHPEITVIGTVGPDSDGEDFDLGWKLANDLKVPLVDEHYYRPPQWFWDNLQRYDNYDRSKSKVYLGEYASHGNALRNALAEAAFLTTLERNGDVVPLTSYAPLLAKRGHTQWKTDLIYFSNTAAYPSINYYVQQLFSVHGGDRYLTTTTDAPKPAAFAASAVRDDRSSDLIVKIVNGASTPQTVNLELKGVAKLASQATKIVLAGASPELLNEDGKPATVRPQTSTLAITPAFAYQAPANSLTVIRIPTR